MTLIKRADVTDPLTAEQHDGNLDHLVALTATAQAAAVAAQAAADAVNAALAGKANSSALGALAALATVGSSQIDNDAVTNAKLANMVTARIKGRVTTGTGDAEDLTAAQVKTLLGISGFAETYLDETTAAGVRGVLGLGALAELASVGTAELANDAVTNAKLANVATATIKGRVTASAGDVEDLSVSQVKALLALAIADISGLGTALSDKLSTSALSSTLVALADVAAEPDGTYVFSYIRSGGVVSAIGREPLVTGQVATCYHVVTGEAEGMDDQGYALDRWLHEFQTLTPAAGIVQFQWPADVSGQRDRSSCRSIDMTDDIEIGIDALSTTVNPEIFNADKSYDIIFRLRNSTGGDLTATLRATGTGRMPTSWRTGFTAPSVPAGGTVLAVAHVNGNAAVFEHYALAMPDPVFELVGTAFGGTNGAGFTWPAHAAPSDGIHYLLVLTTYNPATDVSAVPGAPADGGYTTVGGGFVNTASPAHRMGVGIHYKIAASASENLGTLPANFTGSCGGAVFRVRPMPEDPADLFGDLQVDAGGSVFDTSFPQPALTLGGKRSFVLQASVLASLTSGAQHVLRADLENANKKVRTGGGTGIGVSAEVTSWASGSSTIGQNSRQYAAAVQIIHPEDI